MRLFGRKFLVGAWWALLSTSGLALSSNDQISLAGTGQFEKLAQGIELMIGHEPMKVADWHALCFSYSRIKNYSRVMDCLDNFEKALAGHDKRSRLFGLDDATPTLYQMRAEALIELAQYEQAIIQTERILKWYRDEQSDDNDVLVNALTARSLASALIGKRSDAEKYAAELDAVPMGMLSDHIGAKSLAMARVNMALGRWQKTLDALAQDKTIGLRAFMDNLVSGAFLQGLNNWIWIELPRGFMQTKALFELGRIQDAKIGYDHMLSVPQIKANGEIYWLSLLDRARIAVIENQLKYAAELYTKAADEVELQRASINTEANKIGFVGDKQAIYAGLVDVQLKLGLYEAAFETMERAKSRALVDMLASRPSFIPPKQVQFDSVRKFQVLMDRLTQADLDTRQQTEVSITSRKPTSPRAFAMELPPAMASLVSVSALNVDEAKKLLGDDEALVVYFAHGVRLYATVMQRGLVSGMEINAVGLDDDIRKLRTGLQKQAKVALQLQALYDRLIAPLKVSLNVKRLTVVAHGSMHYLPFAALNDGNQDLIDRFNLRMLPSASVLKYLRPSETAKLEHMLILGNPDLNNPKDDLPGTQVEAEKLATHFLTDNLLLRKQASKTAFNALAGSASYIHVASHGKFDAAQPLYSALFLAPDAQNDGRLSVSDVYQLRLNAELVTLSACETGLGLVANGDDVIGLTRGFLYAGASAVVASLWQVDDDSTAFLMLRMYEHIQKGNRREALRLAQIETRAKFPNPFDWAGFYLTGLN